MSGADGPTVVAGINGQPKVVVHHSSGSVLEAYLHGGTITSFRNPAGQELLFVSTAAVFDGELCSAHEGALQPVVV
jgi:D-hexose-6-phosphate mutarotase